MTTQSQSQSNGSPVLATQELGSDDSGFRRRIASVTATESYFKSLRNTIDHVKALEQQGILDGNDVSEVGDMIKNTFRQDHPLLEVDDTVPTVEDLCLNINDQILAEKMDFIQRARDRSEGRERRWANVDS